MREFKRLVSRLKAVLRRRGCAREDAEDLIQDAFERLQTYCKAEEVRNQEAVLVTMVRNAQIDAYRRDKHHSEVRELLLSNPSWSAGIEEEVEIEQRLREVRALLDEWPIRTRDIYLLHHLGYNYDEIAQQIGISASAVEKHMAKAAYLLAQWQAGRQ